MHTVSINQPLDIKQGSLTKKPTEEIKWNTKKNAGKKAKRKKEHMNKYKANSKIVDIKLTISIII